MFSSKFSEQLMFRVTSSNCILKIIQQDLSMVDKKEASNDLSQGSYRLYRAGNNMFRVNNIKIRIIY